jgi:hypothetical protein
VKLFGKHIIDLQYGRYKQPNFQRTKRQKKKQTIKDKEEIIKGEPSVPVRSAG